MAISTLQNTQSLYFQKPKSDTCLINTLPDDVLKKIFQYLSEESLDSTAKTCSRWQIQTVTSIQEKIEHFLSILIGHLEDDSQEQHALQSLKADLGNTWSDATNLTQMEVICLNLRDKVVEALLTLPEKQLEPLEKLQKKNPPPPFFKEVFQGSRIYQQFQKLAKEYQPPDGNDDSATNEEFQERLRDLECEASCLKMYKLSDSITQYKDYYPTYCATAVRCEEYLGKGEFRNAYLVLKQVIAGQFVEPQIAFLSSGVSSWGQLFLDEALDSIELCTDRSQIALIDHLCDELISAYADRSFEPSLKDIRGRYGNNFYVYRKHSRPTDFEEAIRLAVRYEQFGKSFYFFSPTNLTHLFERINNSSTKAELRNNQYKRIFEALVQVDDGIAEGFANAYAARDIFDQARFEHLESFKSLDSPEELRDRYKETFKKMLLVNCDWNRIRSLASRLQCSDGIFNNALIEHLELSTETAHSSASHKKQRNF